MVSFKINRYPISSQLNVSLQSLQLSSWKNILGVISDHIIPFPPKDGCPGKSIGCTDGNCPLTCFCEDHCSWEKCSLEEAPKDCLDGSNSKWVWDPKKLHWVAQLVGMIRSINKK